MTKKKWIFGKVGITKPGKKAHWFTLRFVSFDPDEGFTGDQVKDIVRKQMHLAKAKMKDNYGVAYVKAEKTGFGSRAKTSFSTCVKPEANCVFVFPNAVRRAAMKAINELTLSGNYELK